MTGKSSAKKGVWAPRTVFLFRKLDEDGSGGYFATSQAKTDTPTLTFDTIYPSSIQQGIIYRIHYRLKPTNAVTYILRLYEAAKAGDYESNMRLIWESPALQASDVDYDRAELMIPFWLSGLAGMNYAIEWSGAPGTTVGFIHVQGIAV
jgi:alpha-glucosidase (family GH31 glycosyl hydrolase)